MIRTIAWTIAWSIAGIIIVGDVIITNQCDSWHPPLDYPHLCPSSK